MAGGTTKGYAHRMNSLSQRLALLSSLLTVFEELRASSQLIVITHQKRTMEIADALYGVSMRQDGVSAVVGQRVGTAA